MDTKHTATPWKVEKMPSGRITITAGQLFIAGHACDYEGLDADNAELIVRAVNAHDALVTALQAMEAWALQINDEDSRVPLDVRDAVRAALTKAGALVFPACVGMNRCPYERGR